MSHLTALLTSAEFGDVVKENSKANAKEKKQGQRLAELYELYPMGGLVAMEVGLRSVFIRMRPYIELGSLFEI